MTNRIIMLTCKCHKGQIYIVDSNSRVVSSISKEFGVNFPLVVFPFIEIKSINDILKAYLT